MGLKPLGHTLRNVPEKSGTFARGPLRKQEYVIEILGDYPKKVCFTVREDKIDELEIRDGQELAVHFDAESRKYNGRWYTDVQFGNRATCRYRSRTRA